MKINIGKYTKNRFNSDRFDLGLIFACILLPLAGLLVLYSAGFDPDLENLFWDWLPFKIQSLAFYKQFIFFLIGILAMLSMLILSPQLIYKLAYPFYILSLMLVVLVYFVGEEIKGSQRWLHFGPINFQPSELVKIALILCLARYLSKNLPQHRKPKKKVYGLRDLLIPGVLILLPFLLIAKQPDLGTALTVVTIGLSMLLFVGIELRFLSIMMFLGTVSIYPIWQFFLKTYQKQRLLILLNPEADPLGTGYHISQSKIAIGSGGLFGKGFLNGTQTQLEFLPEHTTDFIFSVLAEEWGFLGCIFVLSLYFFFFYRVFKVLNKSKEPFSALVIFGIGTLICFHTVVNIGMVIGLLPVVGIPMPFFSYGGSALLVLMLSVGLILTLNMRRLETLS